MVTSLNSKVCLHVTIYSPCPITARKVSEGYAFTGVCLSTGGVGGWADPPHRILRDMINKRAVRILLECILVTTVIKMCSFYCYQYNGEKMDPSPILSFIPVVKIGTMLNFNGDNNVHGLKTLRVKRPLV